MGRFVLRQTNFCWCEKTLDQDGISYGDVIFFIWGDIDYGVL